MDNRGGKPQDGFEAVADPTRRAIIALLRDHGSRTAGQIAEAFPAITRPAVSRHLRVLREAELVDAERIGREWHYRLNAVGLASMHREWFESFAPVWEDSLQRLKEQVESASNVVPWRRKPSSARVRKGA